MKISILPLALTAVLFLSVACREQKTVQTEDKTYPLLKVELSDRLINSSFPATLRGRQTVEIRPQVSGMITEILINEGDPVRKDSILFVIDQTQYKAAYEIAVANVKSAEAALSTAELVLESTKDLYENEVVSEFDLMTAQNDLVEAEAKLALAKAEETRAYNNLSYTEVRSPVNGVASMTPYRVGALVSSSIAEPLVKVSDDSQIYAYFSMAESQVLDMVLENGNSIQNTLKDIPSVQLQMSNGKMYDQPGKITALSGTIDQNTGSVSIRASFPNRNHILRDGGSGSVIIPHQMNDCIVIPQSATFEIQDRIFVFKVVDGKASSAQIKVAGVNNGSEYVVEDGLEVGDVIISEGAGLVQEGALIPNAEEFTSSEEE